MSKSPRHMGNVAFPAYAADQQKLNGSTTASTAPSSSSNTMAWSLPAHNTSVLGMPLRIVCPFSCQTARCYQVWRDDRSTLLPTVTDEHGYSATTSPTTRGAAPQFPPDSDTTLSPPRPLPSSGSVIPRWCRVATSTDLLLVVICILINVPAVAKLLTVACTLGGEAPEVSSVGGLMPLSDPSSSASALTSHRVAPSAAMESSLTAQYQTGVRALLEHLTIIFAWFVVTTPAKVVYYLESVRIALAARIVNENSASDGGTVEWILSAGLALHTFWTTFLVPYLIEPPIFWSVLIVCLVALHIRVRAHRICVEEVLVVRGLGIQISTRDYRGVVIKSKLLDIGKIRSVFIHEAFFRQQVIFYLGVLMTDESTVTVLLEETLPRLAVLRPVLCGIRSVLFLETEEGPTLAETEEPNMTTASSSS